MKTVIHVNQHNIKHNAKVGAEERRPVLTCKTYKANEKGQMAIIRDETGREIGRFIYSPDKPLPCGAKVWFETQHSVEVIG